MNKNLLRAAIIREGMTNTILANKLGLSQCGFSKKITGYNDFTVREMRMIGIILNLTSKEIIDIFYGD